MTATGPALVAVALSGFGRGALRFAAGLAVAVLIAFAIVVLSLVALAERALSVIETVEVVEPAGPAAGGGDPSDAAATAGAPLGGEADETEAPGPDAAGTAARERPSTPEDHEAVPAHATGVTN